jgi:hypothetical protein
MCRVYARGVQAQVIGFTLKGIQAHRALEYREGKDRLEFNLKKDDRFGNVRVFYYPTSPSVFIAAPRDLPVSARADLERLMNDAFDSLPAPIYYKDVIDQTNGE